MVVVLYTFIDWQIYLKWLGVWDLLSKKPMFHHPNRSKFFITSLRNSNGLDMTILFHTHTLFFALQFSLNSNTPNKSLRLFLLYIFCVLKGVLFSIFMQQKISIRKKQRTFWRAFNFFIWFYVFVLFVILSDKNFLRFLNF